MRTILSLIFTVLAGPALAHVGHIGELAGHTHWVAGAAIGLAIALAAWGSRKGKDDEAAEENDSEEAEEQPA